MTFAKCADTLVWCRGSSVAENSSRFNFFHITLQDFNRLSDGVKDQSWRVPTLPYTQSLPACVWTPAAPSSAIYSVSSKSAYGHANCASPAQLAATGCYGFDSVGKQTRWMKVQIWTCPLSRHIAWSLKLIKGTVKKEGLKMVFRCWSTVQL